MLYLDANVFIYPALYDDDKAKAAAALLARVQGGQEEALTCALTIDEVLYVVGKYAGRDAGIRVGKAALSLPNLGLLPVTADDVRAAVTLMEAAARPQPRDAIHAAVALKHHATTVVSDDEIFGKIDGLKRRPLLA